MPHLMTTLALGLGLALASACHSAPSVSSPPPPAQEAPMTQTSDPTAPLLEWTLTRADDHLEIRYSLTNRSSARIYVVDQMYTGSSGPRTPAPDRVVVAPSDRPDTVRFVRGIVETSTMVEVEHAPGATFVDPGQAHEGSAKVPLPLKAWHPYAPEDPLSEDLKYAVLEIATLSGEGEWGSVQLSDGGTATVPQLGYYFRAVKLVSGGAKPLP